MKFAYQIATEELPYDPTMTCYQGKLEKSLADIASFGYNAVELMTTDPSTYDWATVKKLVEKNGLSVSLICTGEVGRLGYTFTSPDENVRRETMRRTKELIDLAAYLGANINAGLLRGKRWPGNTEEQTERYEIEGFREVCDYAAQKGVSFALETGAFVFTNYLNTLGEALDIVKKVDRPNLMLMLDLFHLYVEEPDYIEAIKTYAPYNLHVHLADNNRMYPGACGIDFEKVIRTFHDTGFDGDQHTAASKAAEHLLPILKKIYG